MTRQKQRLHEALAGMGAFFSAEQLHARVRGIGLATVYRFLNERVKEGELHPYACDRRTVYSRTGTSHCHYVCERTGAVTHFAIDDLDFLKGKLPGSVTSFQLEVRGVCGDCCLPRRTRAR